MPGLRTAHGLAQIALRQAGMLAHDGFGARALSLFDGLLHLTVLVLRDDQHVSGLRAVGLAHHKT